MWTLRLDGNLFSLPGLAAALGPWVMNAEALLALASGVRGSVIAAGNDDYDVARRVWNGTIDHRPALVVSCLDSADVVEAVNFARVHDLGVSVRSGGHHVAGTAVLDGGLVIDVSGMRAVTLDPVTGRVRVQGGAGVEDEHVLALRERRNALHRGPTPPAVTRCPCPGSPAPRRPTRPIRT